MNNKIPHPRSGLWYASLLGILLGSNSVITRFLIPQLVPDQVNAIRLAIGALSYIVYYMLVRVRKFPFDWRLWIKTCPVGFFGLAVTLTCFSNALKYQSSALTTVMIAFTPITTMLLGYIVLRDQKITGSKFMGMVIGFAGVGIIILNGETGLKDMVQADWRGYALSITGVLSSSISSVYYRRKLTEYDPVDVATIRMVIGMLVVSLGPALVSGYNFSRLTWWGLLIIVGSGIFGTFLTGIIETKLLSSYGLIEFTQSLYISPFFTAFLGIMILDETITTVLALGMGLIVVGLALVNRQQPA